MHEMKKYNPPLQINGLFKFVLFVCSLFVFVPVFAIFEVGSVMINNYQYNLPEYPWLIWVGAFCLAIVGSASIMVQKNIRHSLSYLGLAIVLGSLSNVLHPSFALENSIYSFPLSFVIPVILLVYDYRRKNGRSENA